MRPAGKQREEETGMSFLDSAVMGGPRVQRRLDEGDRRRAGRRARDRRTSWAAPESPAPADVARAARARGGRAARPGRRRASRSAPRSCAAPARWSRSTPRRSRAGSSARPARSRGKAQVETHVAAQECYEAAALPSHPYGELLPSAQPRLSLARRRAGRRRRRDLAVQLPADPLDPLGRARRWRSATRSSSSPTRAPRSPAASSSRGSSRRPACPTGLLHVLPGGADVGAGAGRPTRTSG